MKRYLDLSNEAPVYTMWQMLEPQIESVRRALAREFGCDPEEMAITRNASESLEAIQLGLDLKPGDEILTTTHDYPRMLTAWRQRERRDGVVLKTISFPIPPPSLDDLYQRFEKAVTPRTKVILVCHITNLTGQIFPVKRICQMGRERGIEVIVTARTPSLTSPSRSRTSTATTTAPASTSGSSRRTAPASSTCAARRSRRCGR
jgi:selenocysteine lyase/cysteine desulfurase